MNLQVEVEGHKLVIPYGQVLPGARLRVSISDEIASKEGGFYLFETPLSAYQSDLNYLTRHAGQVISLGDMPTLSKYRRGLRTMSLELGQDELYDIMFLYGKNRETVDSARLSTGSFVPDRMTIDEMKLFIIRRSGLDVDDVKNGKAKIIYKKNGIKETKFEPILGLQIGTAIVSVSQNINFLHYYINSTPDTIRNQILK